MTQQDSVEDSLAAGVTTKVTLPAALDSQNHAILTKYLMACSTLPGFLNAEITPPHSREGEWIVVHRFRTEEQAKSWLQSDDRRQVLLELPKEKDVRESMQPHVAGGSVFVSVTSKVKPGCEVEYRQWLQKIQATQSQFPGYEGSYVQPPAGTANSWMTLLKFSTPETLESWLGSEQRSNLMNEAKAFIQTENIRRMTSSFPGWAPVDPETQEEVANWKIAMLIVLGVLPLGLLETRFVTPNLPKINTALQALIVNLINVSIITWITMPICKFFFLKWMLPEKSRRKQIEITGAAIIASLYVLIVCALWNLN